LRDEGQGANNRFPKRCQGNRTLWRLVVIRLVVAVVKKHARLYHLVIGFCGNLKGTKLLRAIPTWLGMKMLCHFLTAARPQRMPLLEDHFGKQILDGCPSCLSNMEEVNVTIDVHDTGCNRLCKSRGLQVVGDNPTITTIRIRISISIRNDGRLLIVDMLGRGCVLKLTSLPIIFPCSSTLLIGRTLLKVGPAPSLPVSLFCVPNHWKKDPVFTAENANTTKNVIKCEGPLFTMMGSLVIRIARHSNPKSSASWIFNGGLDVYPTR
jgi:hypothetical protein